MARLPHDYIPRQRLLDRLDGAPFATLLAGGGFGKSTLATACLHRFDGAGVRVDLATGDADAEVLVLRLSRALDRAGLTDLARAMDGGRDPVDAIDVLADRVRLFDEPIMLVVDDVHHATGTAAEVLARLLQTLTPPAVALLSGRSLPPALRAIGRGQLCLDEEDLAFTVEETATLLAGAGDTSEVAELHRRTRGWPAAVALLGNHPTPNTTHTEIGELVAEQLSGLDATMRSVAVQMSHLPVLDDEIATALGHPTALDDLERAGLPLQHRGLGRHFLDPVTEVLRGHAPPDPMTARAAAGVHIDRGEPLIGATVLATAGLHHDAAAAIAALSAAQSTGQDVGELRRVVHALPTGALEAHPRALLHLARSYQSSFERPACQALLTQLTALVGEVPSTTLAREVLAEIAVDAVRDGRVDDAMRIAEEVLVATPAHEDVVRARALDPLGWAKARNADYTAAERLLDDAVIAASRAGVEEWAAEALLTLAIRVHHPTGAFDRAETCLRDALVRYPRRSPRTAVVLSFLADVLNDAGRADEAAAAADEGYAAAVRLGSQQGAGYAAWALARSAAARGDAVATVEALTRVEQHHGDWFDSTAGPTFLSEAAMMLERVGESPLADQYVARATPRRTEAPCDVVLAELALAVRRRARDVDAVITRARALDGWSPLDRLRRETLAVAAAMRNGSDDAVEQACALFDQAVLIGQPRVPLVAEPDLGAALAELAVAAGSTAARSALQAMPYTVRVLGGFSVSRGGRTVTLRSDSATVLVKLLAVNAPITPAEAARVVAPTASGHAVTSGMAEVRAALARLDLDAPGLVVQHDDVLRFADGVSVDAAQLVHENAEAQRFADTAVRRALVAARTVVARYGGELLPADTDLGWTAEPRRRMRADYLAAEDLLTNAAIDAGDVDEAIAAVQRALAVEPDDEDRHVRLAELYLRQGRRSRATRALEDARNAALGMGVRPSDRYRHALRLLHAVDDPRPDAHGPPPAGASRGPDPPPRWEIRVFGGFEVHDAGAPVDLPPGRPRQLVALLVLAGGHLSVEALTGRLWPDVDPHKARLSLREALHRLRRRAPIAERDPAGGLRLAADSHSDLAAFDAAARRAEAGGDGGLAAARRAVSLYRGPLMPDEDAMWATHAREAAAHQVLSLLDRLVVDARQHNRLEEAAGLAERAAAHDLLDDARLITTAELLVQAGRARRAQALVARSTAVHQDHDIPPSPDVQALARQLATALGQPATTD